MHVHAGCNKSYTPVEYRHHACVYIADVSMYILYNITYIYVCIHIYIICIHIIHSHLLFRHGVTCVASSWTYVFTLHVILSCLGAAPLRSVLQGVAMLGVGNNLQEQRCPPDPQSTNVDIWEFNQSRHLS